MKKELTKGLKFAAESFQFWFNERTAFINDFLHKFSNGIWNSFFTLSKLPLRNNLYKAHAKNTLATLLEQRNAHLTANEEVQLFAYFCTKQ